MVIRWVFWSNRSCLDQGFFVRIKHVDDAVDKAELVDDFSCHIPKKIIPVMD